MAAPAQDRRGSVLVVDCGSTNLKVVVVDELGRFVAESSRANSALKPATGEPDWLVWDYEALWEDIRRTIRETMQVVDARAIRAVMVTTWGADGAPVRRDGSPTYLPIAWHCPRTKSVVEQIAQQMAPWDMYRVTGYQMISFNTLFKLAWLRRYEPKALDDAFTWLMMPGLVAHSLTGEFSIEPTSASTMMAMDLARRDWSPELLRLVGLDPSFFPAWSEPPDIVGQVTKEAAAATGLAPGTPVLAGGHDTQFAAIGSGALGDEAVLSSGTWEILEVRVDRFRPTRQGFRGGVLVEADVLPGLWDAQLLMVGSALLEWVRRLLFPEIVNRGYEALIREAQAAPPGASGVTLLAAFVSDSGPTRLYGTKGTVLGLSLATTRGHLYRAALEGLSYQLRHALEVLEASTRFEARGIRAVGGGSRNPLWNQIRSDVTVLPISSPSLREATVIGAALTAFVGIGTYQSIHEAQRSIDLKTEVFQPSADSLTYQPLYRRYRKLPRALRTFYGP